MDFEEKKYSNYDLDNTNIHAYIHAYQGNALLSYLTRIAPTRLFRSSSLPLPGL